MNTDVALAAEARRAEIARDRLIELTRLAVINQEWDKVEQVARAAPGLLLDEVVAQLSDDQLLELQNHLGERESNPADRRSGAGRRDVSGDRRARYEEVNMAEQPKSLDEMRRESECGEKAPEVTKEVVGNEPGGAPHQGDVRTK